MYNFQFGANANATPKIDSSRIWFAVFVPLIALLIEAFSATSFRLGVLVWVTAAVSMYAACIADLRYLRSIGVATDGLASYIVLPPLYVFKRSKRLGLKTGASGMMIVFMIYALASNNFVAAMDYDDEYKLAYVQESYAQSLSGVEASGLSTVKECLEDHFGEDKEIKWSESERSGRITVTAECEGMRIVFTVPFDGYAFGEVSVTECSENGKKLEGEELDEKLAEIFSDDTETSSSSSSSTSDSGYTKA